MTGVFQSWGGKSIWWERFHVGNLMYIIRQHLELTPDIAIYLLIGTKLFPASELGIIYDENADNDGFIYKLF